MIFHGENLEPRLVELDRKLAKAAMANRNILLTPTDINILTSIGVLNQDSSRRNRVRTFDWR